MVRFLEQIFSRNMIKYNNILDFKVLFKDILIYNKDYNLFYDNDDLILNFKNGDKKVSIKLNELVIEGEIFKYKGEYKTKYSIISKDNTLNISQIDSKLYSLKEELSIEEILKLNTLDLDIINFEKEELDKNIDYYYMNDMRNEYYQITLKLENKEFYINIYKRTYKDLMKAIIKFEYYLNEYICELDKNEKEKFLKSYLHFKELMKDKENIVKKIIIENISILSFQNNIDLKIDKKNIPKFLEVF